MKAEVPLAALREATAWAARALPSRPVVPVLTAIRLEAEGDQLTVAAFDYDTAASMTLPADIAAGPGVALVPGRLVSGLLEIMTGESVQIVSEDGYATLSCGRSVFHLRCLDPRDYPALPVMPELSGTCGSLAAALVRVLPAVGGPKSPASAQGVHLTAGERLLLEATNGYQAVRLELDWEPSVGGRDDMVIPAPAINLIRHLDGEVSVCLSENLAGFAGGGRKLVTRLIAEPYPGVGRYFPGDRPTVVTTPVGTLLGALKATALLRDKDMEAVSLSIGDGVEVSAEDHEAGGGSVTVEGAEVTGPPLTVRFQPARLISAITGSGKTVRLAFAENRNKPALVTSTDDGDSYQHIVMPVAG